MKQWSNHMLSKKKPVGPSNLFISSVIQYVENRSQHGWKGTSSWYMKLMSNLGIQNGHSPHASDLDYDSTQTSWKGQKQKLKPKWVIVQLVSFCQDFSMKKT